MFHDEEVPELVTGVTITGGPTLLRTKTGLRPSPTATSALRINARVEKLPEPNEARTYIYAIAESLVHFFD